MANDKSLIKTEQSSAPIQPYSVDSDPGYGYDFYAPSNGNEVSQKKQFLRFFSILRKHWRLIVGTVVVITTLVVLYEAQRPDYYAAVARIQVNGEMNPAVSGGGGSSIILNQGNDPVYFTTQLRILEGTGLLRRVAKVLDLEHNEAFTNPNKGKKLNTLQNVLKMFGLYEPAQSEIAASDTATNNLELTPEALTDLDKEAEKLAPYVSKIKRGLTIMPVKDTRTANKETRLIEIGFTHGEPGVAAKIANAIADTYVLQNLERKVETNATASEFLQKRVAELQSQIRESEERLINYSRDNQIISLDPSQNTVVQRLGDLNNKLGAAENERISAEAAYRAAMQNPMSAAAAENSDPRTAGLQGQLTTLRQQLAQLKTEYTDEWPEVQRVQRQINLLENELRTSQKRSKDTQASQLEQRYREAAAKERELRADFDVQRGAVLAQNQAAINYRIIQQEIDTNRTLLADLLQKSKETEVILNGTPNNVLVADRALVPRGPDGPRRTKEVLMAFILSIFLGIGLAFLVNWLDDTIRVFDDVEAKLGTPVIGMIPGIHQGMLKRLTSSRRQLGDGGRGSAIVPNDFDQPVVREAFNQVRTSLLLSTNGPGPKTVLVTSGQPSEGKTLTSLNLAKCLAEMGGKVLLIDADLRCPKMHLINGFDNIKGLGDLLTMNGAAMDNLDGAIIEDISSNLDLMTSGRAIPSPATLFSMGKMREIIDKLGETYKYIVIDSPPALYFADSVLLASDVDAVLLVGRVNFSSSEILSLAKKKLQDVNANIVGIVLNDVPIGGYQYYNSEYYSDDSETKNTNGNGDGGAILHLE
ncbi:MAG: polysaccharide biosynthesis tyrosine autokinase [Chloracidobacterium sp.]|nr:polysaccharide biosynthesis tyrosine autokinase [Chloracidobacterium sp.]